jgi:hypothetical protein
MRGVPVAIMLVVGVIFVRNGSVATVRAVCVRVRIVLSMCEGMLVVVAVVREVRMTRMNIVGVIVVLDRGVATALPVLVGVVSVDVVRVRGHGCSLLWWTASSTMCATCWSTSE